MQNCEKMLAIALLIGTGTMFAQGEPTAEQRAAHRTRMDELSQTITIDEVIGDQRVLAVRQKTPLLIYNDNTRRLSDSTLWIWTQNKRPVAVVAVEHYPDHKRGPRWLFELVSLSDHRIAAVRAPELQWTAREPANRWQTIEGTVPATAPAGRLVQMRELLRQFRAWESAVVGGRIDLRPMTSPLLRYDQPAAGVIDGAIFAFANGTNPEVCLLLEARERPGHGSVWQYRLGQMTGAEVTVELRDKIVWQRGNADPPAERDSYVNGWFTSDENVP